MGRAVRATLGRRVNAQALNKRIASNSTCNGNDNRRHRRLVSVDAR
jgi:hypothetical protein